MRRHLLILLASYTLIFPVYLYLANSLLASALHQGQERPLRVVTKVIEPFVIKDEDRLTGFSIDMWEEISLLTDIPFEWVEVETVNEQLEAIIDGDADIAIAAISMTPEREEVLDFTHPYYLAGLQIMTSGKHQSTFASLLSFIFSSRFLIGLGTILVILIFVGHLVWLVERKVNPDFPQHYFKGIWEGMWWAAATVTTVGYGDKTVKDKLGRLIGIFWMFAGLFLIANFTAYVTAEVTASRLQTSITGIDDLPGKRVVTASNTTSAEFLREENISFQTVETIEEAYILLENDEADAIVYDEPVLQFHVANSGNPSLLLVGSPFRLEYYGIALQTESPYKEQINQALLEIRENGTYNELITKWHLWDMAQ